MRPSWDQYFLKLAMLASERATCPRMHCGCVLVRDKFVISTGYNGSLRGQPHCEDEGCLVDEGHCVRTVHAEQNALLQATIHGASTVGATAYVTNAPCTLCAKLLIAAGVKRVVAFSGYHKDGLSRKFMVDAGVTFEIIDQPSQHIEYNLEGYSSARK